MDKYTKIVLTVIAFSLVTINVQLSDVSLIDEAHAKVSCGEQRYNPCYVKIIK